MSVRQALVIKRIDNQQSHVVCVLAGICGGPVYCDVEPSGIIVYFWVKGHFHGTQIHPQVLQWHMGHTGSLSEGVKNGSLL